MSSTFDEILDSNRDYAASFGDTRRKRGRRRLRNDCQLAIKPGIVQCSSHKSVQASKACLRLVNCPPS